MRLLKSDEYEFVSGGTDTDTTKQLKANAELAQAVCGKDKVAEVSTTGFKCKA